MSQKRKLITDVYKQKKRSRQTPNFKQNGIHSREEDEQVSLPVSEVETALRALLPLFPVAKFEHRLPPIAIKHQIYSKISNRDLVDEEIVNLQKAGTIKVFSQSLPGGEQSIELVVLTNDYRSHVQCVMTEFNVPKRTIDKFVATVVESYNKQDVNKDLMMNHFSFTEAEITQLLKVSALTEQAAGSWLISVPNAGIFMKSLTLGRQAVITILKKCKYREVLREIFMKSLILGRQAVITILKKCKYREVLREELELRPWPRVAKLGLLYHIHDIIGADIVESTQTSLGERLQLKE